MPTLQANEGSNFARSLPFCLACSWYLLCASRLRDPLTGPQAGDGVALYTLEPRSGG